MHRSWKIIYGILLWLFYPRLYKVSCSRCSPMYGKCCLISKDIWGFYISMLMKRHFPKIGLHQEKKPYYSTLVLPRYDRWRTDRAGAGRHTEHHSWRRFTVAQQIRYGIIQSGNQETLAVSDSVFIR